MLEVSNLCAFYGPSQALFEVSFSVGAGQVLTLVGRNGAGRSTVARAIVGRVKRTGSIRLGARELILAKSFEIARQGIGYIPENREVFAQLNVEENLLLGKGANRQSASVQPPGWTLERCYALFPRLGERRLAPAGALSGGEQQMLVLCRALMGNPHLLVIDEPTEGLSPHMVELVAQTLGRLKQEGIAMLLIEQKLDIALQLADAVVVLGRGEVVFSGSVAELQLRQDVIDTWVGIA
jgi:branched-chain amino acid transport system ATP-binding protein